jgi:glycosyltransferase involved in cell wall biosynthesis
MPFNSPLVSVGVPVYNGAKYILETLNSINRQTYENMEIHIVDDCSTDDSYNLCKEWVRQSHFPVTVQKNNTNLGVNKTCNIILKKAEGEYLQVFGQDDIMLPGKIEHDINMFKKQGQEVALVYSKMKLIDNEGKFLEQEYDDRIGFDGVVKQDVFLELTKNNFIPAPAVIMKTDVVREIGGYDETLLFDDWDMWLRLAKDYKLLFVDVANVYYRIHAGSMMANKNVTQQQLRNDATIRMFKKHLGVCDEYDKALFQKLRELSIYSYFLGDKKAIENLGWYLQNKFDPKVWLYHKMASIGMKHPFLYKANNKAKA